MKVTHQGHFRSFPVTVRSVSGQFPVKFILIYFFFDFDLSRFGTVALKIIGIRKMPSFTPVLFVRKQKIL